jgi:hypothetical protein
VKPDPNVIFEGSIPENYDRYLGPAFFEPVHFSIAIRQIFTSCPLAFTTPTGFELYYKEQVSNQLRQRSSRYRAAAQQRRTWRLAWCEEILWQPQSKSAAWTWKMSYGRLPKKLPNGTARLLSKALCRRLFGVLFMNNFRGGGLSN